ncbi:hypothetical protein L0F63_004293, partial [Massospora cicadina]
STFKEEEAKRLHIRQFILNQLFTSLSSLDNRSMVTIKLFAAVSIALMIVERKELAKLQFLTLLPEEFENPRLGSVNRYLEGVVEANPRGPEYCFAIYRSLYNGGGEQTTPDSGLLREKGLNCLRNWVQFGIPALELPQITDRLVQNFLWGGSHEICADVLYEILNHRNTVHWLVSAEMQKHVQRAISEEDLCLGRSLMRVYASFGENFYTRVISDMSKVPEGQPVPQIVYLDLVLALTNYPGHFPSDQNISFLFFSLTTANISELGLEFWHSFLEGVLEHVEVKPGPRDVGALLEPVITRLVTVVHSKVMFPATEDLQLWDHDELNTFRIYRRDAGDILVDVLYILKSPYPLYYLDLAINTILALTSGQAKGSDHWQDLEATLFLLRKLSSLTLTPELTPKIIQLFSEPVLGRVLDTNLTTGNAVFSAKYLKLQALKMCGDFTKYYKSDQKVLSAIIHQIVCAFSVPELKAPATTAFRDICEAASLELTFSVETMITTLTSLQNQLGPPELQRILESVACLVTSAQGPDDLIPTRLQAMSQFIVEAQESLVQSLQAVSEDHAVRCTFNNFRCLVACCNGAASGSRAQDVDVHCPTPAVIPYTERVFLVTSRTLELLGHKEDVSIALSSFLDAGLKMSGYPSPFCFPLESHLRLLGAGYHRHVQSAYLDSIRQVVQTYAIKSPSYSDPQHVAVVKQLADIALLSVDITLRHITSPPRIDEQPDLTIALAEFLTKLISMAPHAFLMLPEAAHRAVINFGILGITSQDRQTIRIMANFLIELFILEKREGQYANAFQLNTSVYGLMVQSYGYPLLRQILQCIGSTMPRSYLGLITEMFRKFLAVHHQEAAVWLPDLLGQASFPSTHLEVSSKLRFSGAFLRATNNSMHFKSLVNNFSQMCWALVPSTSLDIILS